MRLIRYVVLAIVVAFSLLARGTPYADADGGHYAMMPTGADVVDSDPGDPGLPPDQ